MGGDSTSVNSAPNKDTLHVDSASTNGANKSVGVFYVSCRAILKWLTFSASNAHAGGIKSISPAVLAAIIGSSIIGLVSIIIIAIFIAQQIRNRHKAAAAQDAESPTFIQDPDLEAGPRGGFAEKAGSGNLQRNSRWTIKSFTSRWSQASFPGQVHDNEPPPALPPLPPGVARLPIPVPGVHRGSQSSVSSGSSGSETLYSQDSQPGSYDHKAGVMVEEVPRRESIESFNHDRNNGVVSVLFVAM